MHHHHHHRHQNNTTTTTTATHPLTHAPFRMNTNGCACQVQVGIMFDTDADFPEAAVAMMRRDAELLLVPSRRTPTTPWLQMLGARALDTVRGTCTLANGGSNVI
jgi:hypothetical protein